MLSNTVEFKWLEIWGVEMIARMILLIKPFSVCSCPGDDGILEETVLMRIGTFHQRIKTIHQCNCHTPNTTHNTAVNPH